MVNLLINTIQIHTLYHSVAEICYLYKILPFLYDALLPMKYVLVVVLYN